MRISSLLPGLSKKKTSGAGDASFHFQDQHKPLVTRYGVVIYDFFTAPCVVVADAKGQIVWQHREREFDTTEILGGLLKRMASVEPGKCVVDVLPEPLLSGKESAPEDGKPRLVVWMPLVVGTEAVGVVVMIDDDLRDFHEADQSHFQNLTTLLGQHLHYWHLAKTGAMDDGSVRELETFMDHTSGDSFASKLCKKLADLTGLDHVFAAQRTDHPSVLRGIAACSKGVSVEPFDYDLDGSPFAGMGGRLVRVVKDQLLSQFPRDQCFSQTGSQSAAAASLCDAKGEFLGLLVVHHSAPLADASRIESLLSVAAGRLSVEVQLRLMANQSPPLPPPPAGENLKQLQTQLSEAQRRADSVESELVEVRRKLEEAQKELADREGRLMALSQELKAAQSKPKPVPPPVPSVRPWPWRDLLSAAVWGWFETDASGIVIRLQGGWQQGVSGHGVPEERGRHWLDVLGLRGNPTAEDWEEQRQQGSARDVWQGEVSWKIGEEEYPLEVWLAAGEGVVGCAVDQERVRRLRQIAEETGLQLAQWQTSWLALPFGVFRFDRHGYVSEVNQVLLQWMGWQDGVPESTRWSDLFGSPEQQRDAEAFIALVEGQTEAFEIERTFIPAGGVEARRGLLGMAAIRDDQGEFAMGVGALVDLESSGVMAESRALRNRVVELEERLNVLQGESQEARVAAESRAQRLAELEEDLTQAREAGRQKVEELTRELSALREEKSTLDTRVAELLTEIEKFAEQRDTWMKQWAELRQELDEAISQKQVLESDLRETESLRQRLAEIEKQLAEALQSSEKTQQVDQLQAELFEKDTQLAELQSQCADLQSQIKSLHETNASLSQRERRIDELERELAEARQQIEGKEELERQLSEWREASAAESSKAKRFESKAEELRRQVGELQEKAAAIDQLRAELGQSRQRILELESWNAKETKVVNVTVSSASESVPKDLSIGLLPEEIDSSSVPIPPRAIRISQDYTIVQVGDEAAALLGHSAEALLQLRLDDLLDVESLRQVPAYQGASFEGGEEATRLSLKVRGQDGSLIELMSQWGSLPDGWLVEFFPAQTFAEITEKQPTRTGGETSPVETPAKKLPKIPTPVSPPQQSNKLTPPISPEQTGVFSGEQPVASLVESALSQAPSPESEAPTAANPLSEHAPQDASADWTPGESAAETSMQAAESETEEEVEKQSTVSEESRAETSPPQVPKGAAVTLWLPQILMREPSAYAPLGFIILDHEGRVISIGRRARELAGLENWNGEGPYLSDVCHAVNQRGWQPPQEASLIYQQAEWHMPDGLARTVVLSSRAIFGEATEALGMILAVDSMDVVREIGVAELDRQCTAVFNAGMSIFRPLMLEAKQGGEAGRRRLLLRGRLSTTNMEEAVAAALG